MLRTRSGDAQFDVNRAELAVGKLMKKQKSSLCPPNIIYSILRPFDLSALKSLLMPHGNKITRKSEISVANNLHKVRSHL